MSFIGRMFTPPKPKVAAPPPPPDPQIAIDRQKIADQQAQLDRQRDQFTASQNQALDALAQATAAANNREAAPQLNNPQGSLTGTPPTLSSAGTEDETDPTLDSQRKGRKGLRIDLQTSAQGTNGSGLNVPRG